MGCVEVVEGRGRGRWEVVSLGGVGKREEMVEVEVEACFSRGRERTGPDEGRGFFCPWRGLRRYGLGSVWVARLWSPVRREASLLCSGAGWIRVGLRVVWLELSGFP